VDQIIAVLLKNAENAATVVRNAVASMPAKRNCKCGAALAHAILTDRDKIPPATREKLKLILGKYLENKTS
jgi:5'-methylthioadenosine phosphorylase